MAEPITLAEAKAQCRIRDDASEDALISSYIVAAREWVEHYTGHILVQRQVTEQRDCFTGYFELRWRPVISVDAVRYTDSGGATATYPSFLASSARYPTRVYPALNGSWPTLGTNGEVAITYTAGYALGEEPQALLHAMLLLIGHWFVHREAANIGSITAVELPLAVEALCGQRRPVLL